MNTSLKKKIIHFSSRFDRNEIDNSYPIDYCLPVYHTVSDEHLPHLKHIINYKNKKQFEDDLDLMLKYFHFVNWDEFKDAITGKIHFKEKFALLTFDNGYREFYDVIAPILERKGVYAINFINPKFINNGDMMFRAKTSIIIDTIIARKQIQPIVTEYFGLKKASEKELIKKVNLINYLDQGTLDELALKIEIDFGKYLNDYQPYLSEMQMKSLYERGFGFGAHSWDHPLYFELSCDEQLSQTFRSVDYLEENGFQPECFAFPFTDFGVKNEFFKTIFEERSLFCSFGSAGIKLDSFYRNFQRIPMETGETAEEILKDQVSYFKLKKLFYKNKIRR